MAAYNFVDHAIPFDCQGSMTLGMALLRQKDVSKKLLTQFLVNYVGEGDLSFQRIGNIAMVILGSGGVGNQIHEMIKGKLEWNEPWKAFLDSLGGSEGSLPLCRFLEALKNTFNVNRKKVKYYMSPHCFLYLVENLLNQTASVQGYIVTTKSAFIEWLMYRHGVVPHLEESPEPVHGLLIDAITEILDDQRDMADWTGKKHENSLPLLVTRMIVILCLLQANFGRYLDRIFEILQRNDITRQLPLEFWHAILKEGRHHFLSAISKAFMKIDNPLVIVNLGGDFPVTYCPNTVFVDMKVESCKDDILRRTLFRKTQERSLESLFTEAAAEEARDSCGATDSGSETVSATAFLDTETNYIDEEIVKGRNPLKEVAAANTIKEDWVSCRANDSTTGTVYEASCLETDRNYNAEEVCNVDSNPLKELSAEEEAQFSCRVTDYGTEKVSESTCLDTQENSNAEETQVSCEAIVFTSITDSIRETVSETPCLEIDVSPANEKGQERDAPTDSGCFWNVFEAISGFLEVYGHEKSYAKEYKVNVDKCSLSTGGDEPKIPINTTTVEDINQLVNMLDELKQSYAQKIKVIVDPLLTADVKPETPIKATEDDMNQFVNMLDELKQILSTFDSSEPGVAGKASSIKEICKRLLSRRTEMDRLLSQLGSSTDGIASGESSSRQDCGVVSESGVDSEESSSEVEAIHVISKDNKKKKKKQKKSKKRRRD